MKKHIEVYTYENKRGKRFKVTPLENFLNMKEDYLKVVEDNTHLLKTFNRRYETFKKELKEKDKEIERLREHLKTTIKYNHEIIENNNELRSCITETGSQNDILQEELEKAKDINVDLAFENKELKEKLESLKECKENPLAKFRPVEEWRNENNILKEENKRLKENNEVLTELLKGEEEERLWMLEYIYCDDRGNCKTVSLDPQPKEELEEIIGMDSNNWVQYKMMEVQ